MIRRGFCWSAAAFPWTFFRKGARSGVERHPTKIDGARVLAVAHITQAVTPKGTTLHRVNGEEVGPFAALAVGQYEEDENVYLFYCDEQWNAITDICRDSLDAAKGQAAFEYDGINECWIAVE